MGCCGRWGIRFIPRLGESVTRRRWDCPMDCICNCMLDCSSPVLSWQVMGIDELDRGHMVLIVTINGDKYMVWISENTICNFIQY